MIANQLIQLLLQLLRIVPEFNLYGDSLGAGELIALFAADRG